MRPAKSLLFVAAVLGLSLLGSPGMRGQDKPAPPAAAPQLGFPPPDEDVAALKQAEQRYAATFRQIQRTELHFMRIAAQPTKQQYERIAADSAVAMKAALRKYARAFRNSNGDAMPGSAADPRAAIRTAIGSSVRATLAPEQAARYQKELDSRTAARKRVVVLNLLAMMDKTLILRREQREKLSEVLMSHWIESWNQTEILTYGGQYYPQMPDAQINPILSEAQRTIWRGVQRGTQFGAELEMLVAPDLKDEVWDAEPPPKNSKPAAPKADEKP